MKVCVGGTFNIFHKGHKILLEKALVKAGKTGRVDIGVTKGKLLEGKEFVRPYSKRVQSLQTFIEKKEVSMRIRIIPIAHPYGLAVEKSYDAIVVSPETRDTANKINSERIKRGKKALDIVEISYVLAEDDKPISSTRIHQGIIDSEGHLLR